METWEVADWELDEAGMDLMAQALSLDAKNEGFVLHDLYTENGKTWAVIEKEA